MSSGIARYLKPWLARREKAQLRVAELRSRDGDNCRRCKRPMNFDLPPGHDQAPVLVPVRANSGKGSRALDDLCLCHVRCNGVTVDNTEQVQERLRLRAEESVAPRKRAAGRR